MSAGSAGGFGGLGFCEQRIEAELSAGLEQGSLGVDDGLVAFGEAGLRIRHRLFEAVGDDELTGAEIDLSAIDASSAAGVQDFVFIGSAAFTGLGQLRYENGQLHGNVNGTNAADFTITLVNAPVSLSSGDFIL